MVIAGGGVAALEAALALRTLAGDKVRLTLLTPADEFVYQPVATLEPYNRKPPRRLPVANFAADVNAVVERDTLVSVNASTGSLVTGRGRELGYDALLVAIGAMAQKPLAEAVLLHPARPDKRLNAVIDELDAGLIGSLAFVVPSPAWPLPIYELALLARERVDKSNMALDLTIITAEDRPLECFGSTVSVAAADLLTKAGIKVLARSIIETSDDRLIVRPGNVELSADRIVAVPRLEGPRIEGLPYDVDGFVPITANCAVPGVDGVYVAGDATDFPVKFGAIAAKQADAAAESIAVMAGATLVPTPFDGVVHGILFSGLRRKVYFSARIENGSVRESEVSEQPFLPHQAKIAARHLGSYLDDRWASGPRWLGDELAWQSTVAKLRADKEGSV